MTKTGTESLIRCARRRNFPDDRSGCVIHSQLPREFPRKPNPLSDRFAGGATLLRVQAVFQQPLRRKQPGLYSLDADSTLAVTAAKKWYGSLKYAEITGWGKYAPPVTMTNHDLARVIDTSDDWIYSRSGIRKRHFSHVSTGEMSWLACERALAAAGVDADQVDLIILGSTTPEEICPNTASFVKNSLGAANAACFDLNSACTSWFYGLNVATDMIKAGTIQTALVIGAERISLALDWRKRESCVLFGDGAGAVVVEAVPHRSGLLTAKSGCVSDTREFLHIPEWGLQPGRFSGRIEVSLDFQGQEIFKNAVRGMAEACEIVLQREGLEVADIDLFIPHQANIRIIQTLAKKLDFPMEKVVVRIEEYANTSAASIPLALCDALSSGQIKPGMTLLTATFGAGLTWGAGLIRWGNRTDPVSESEHSLPGFEGSAFDLLAESFAYHEMDVSHLLSRG